MAAERPSKRVCLDTFLFTSESVGEGHPGKQGRAGLCVSADCARMDIAHERVLTYVVAVLL